MQKDLAILILAAGSSTRLGRAKQLVVYKGESLLRRSILQALALTKEVFVVLGHEYEACVLAINDLPVQILYNQEYTKGMGHSLAFGIFHTHLFKRTLIMLCDQPFIPMAHYQALLDAADNDFIVASVYQLEQKLAVPAIFPQCYYEALLKLDGDKGAQALLQREKCIHVPLQKDFTIDIDTTEDIQKYL